MSHKFNQCEHNWQFHSPMHVTHETVVPSTYRCDECSTVITLEEKWALDNIQNMIKSLSIQERQSKKSMRANIISAIMMIIAVIAILVDVWVLW